MTNILQTIAGMGAITEQVIATDFLISAKTGVKNYAAALSETATPEVREILRRHLNDAIETHGRILNFMIDRGYYHVYNPEEQMIVDMKAADTVLNLHN